MDVFRLPAEADAVRRFVEELWLPYQRELETIVERFALADDADLVAEELDHRLDLHGEEGHRTWVAVTDADDGAKLADADVGGEFVGFIATDLDESPSVFDRPDRLVVGDVYVREPYRGTGLARELFDRAGTRARETGCDQLALDVDVGDERAIGLYEKLGFETYRYRMVAEVGE